MQFQKVDRAHQIVSRWSGGTTTQLSIEPLDSCYGDRDFLWRLSSAAVELLESDFTPLPDYRRILMILRGSLTLTHDGGEEIHLKELEQDIFDGGSRTISRGQVVDFNLMLRKNACEGALEAKVLLPEESWSFHRTESPKPVTHFFYCCQGSVLVQGTGLSTLTLTEGEGLRIDCRAGERAFCWQLENPPGEEKAVLVRAEIHLI